MVLENVNVNDFNCNSYRTDIDSKIENNKESY